MYFDSYYLVLVVAPMIIGLWAQNKISSTYKKYSQLPLDRGSTGAEIARKILDKNKLSDVRIEKIQGSLTDHFDPKAGVIRLSRGVHDGNSVAAIGVAAHECGHALQYATDYAPIKIRSSLIPITNFGTKLAVPLVLVGMMVAWYPLVYVGLIGYALIAIFQLITLPVEFNASNRALVTLSSLNMTKSELQGAKKVLDAAAMTYVAALISAVTQLLHLLIRANRRNSRR